MRSTEFFKVRGGLRDAAQVVRRPLHVGRKLAVLADDAFRGRLARVPLRLCMDVHGFAYGEPGWNPYRSLAEELRDEPRRPPDDTRFAGFVRRLNAPDYTTMMTFHDPASAARLPKLPYGSYPWGTLEWHAVTVDPERFHERVEWAVQRRDSWTVLRQAIHVRTERPAAKPRRIEIFDRPKSGERPLEIHFRKVSALLRSIDRHGYRPLLGNAHAVPTVAVLARRDPAELRYLVKDRNHFLAVLAALGCTEAWVRIDTRHFPIVREAEIDDWPWVRSGLLEREAARTFFRLYFRLDGRERARALGVAV